MRIETWRRLLSSFVLGLGLSSAVGWAAEPIDEWIKQLRSSDLETRRDAAYAIADAESRDPALLPALIDALRDRDDQVWAATVQALARWQDDAAEAVPALLEQLDTRDGQRQYRAAYALGKIGRSRLDALRATFDAGDAREKIGVVRALGWMGPDGAPMAQEVAELLGSESEELADAAVESLAKMGDPAQPALLAATRREEPTARARAVVALGRLELNSAAATQAFADLGQDEASSVRAAALQAMARFAPREATLQKLLIAGLSDPEPVVQRAAATALLRCPEAAPQAVDALVQLLDGDPETASIAAYTLGRLGTRAESAIPALLDRWVDRDQAMAADALAQIGPATIPGILQQTEQHRLDPADAAKVIGTMGRPAQAAMQQELESPLAERRITAILSLSHLATRADASDVVTALIQSLEDRDGRVRAASAAGLGRLEAQAAPATAKLLERAASDPDAVVRAASLTALFAIGIAPDQLLPPILGGLKDASADVRRRSAEALGQLEPFPESAVDPLVKTLSDPDSTVRAAAASALGSAAETGGSAVGPLIARLDDPDEQVRQGSIRALGQLGGQASAAVPVLLQQLTAAETQFSRELVEALGAIGPAAHDAVPALERSLQGADAALRAAAVHSLGQILTDPESLVPRLCAALDDSDWSVRRQAADRLGSFGADAQAAVPQLLVLLQQSEDTDFASEALRRIDAAPPEAVPRLLQMLQEGQQDRRARYYALHLLGKAGPAARPALPALREMLKEAEPRARGMLERTIRELESLPEPENE